VITLRVAQYSTPDSTLNKTLATRTLEYEYLRINVFGEDSGVDVYKVTSP